MRGFIYVAIDSDRPQILKIGFTTRTVAKRLSELSASSAVATPLVELASFPSDDVAYDEKAIHTLLEEHRHGKEWFKIRLPEALVACRKVLRLVEPPKPKPRVTRHLPEMVLRGYRIGGSQCSRGFGDDG